MASGNRALARVVATAKQPASGGNSRQQLHRTRLTENAPIVPPPANCANGVPKDGKLSSTAVESLNRRVASPKRRLRANMVAADKLK